MNVYENLVKFIYSVYLADPFFPIGAFGEFAGKKKSRIYVSRFIYRSPNDIENVFYEIGERFPITDDWKRGIERLIDKKFFDLVPSVIANEGYFRRFHPEEMEFSPEPVITLREIAERSATLEEAVSEAFGFVGWSVDEKDPTKNDAETVSYDTNPFSGGASGFRGYSKNEKELLSVTSWVDMLNVTLGTASSANVYLSFPSRDAVDVGILKKTVGISGPLVKKPIIAAAPALDTERRLILRFLDEFVKQAEFLKSNGKFITIDSAVDDAFRFLFGCDTVPISKSDFVPYSSHPLLAAAAAARRIDGNDVNVADEAFLAAVCSVVAVDVPLKINADVEHSVNRTVKRGEDRFVVPVSRRGNVLIEVVCGNGTCGVEMNETRSSVKIASRVTVDVKNLRINVKTEDVTCELLMDGNGKVPFPPLKYSDNSFVNGIMNKYNLELTRNDFRQRIVFGKMKYKYYGDFVVEKAGLEAFAMSGAELDVSNVETDEGIAAMIAACYGVSEEAAKTLLFFAGNDVSNELRNIAEDFVVFSATPEIAVSETRKKLDEFFESKGMVHTAFESLGDLLKEIDGRIVKSSSVETNEPDLS